MGKFEMIEKTDEKHGSNGTQLAKGLENWI
jgi:hypothetical protein